MNKQIRVRHFEVGKVYQHINGSDYIVLKRWFENNGCLEMLELCLFPDGAEMDRGVLCYDLGQGSPAPFVRCARAMAYPVFDVPRSETRGGVTHPDRCEHSSVPLLTEIKSKTYGRICRLCGLSRERWDDQQRRNSMEDFER